MFTFHASFPLLSRSSHLFESIQKCCCSFEATRHLSATLPVARKLEGVIDVWITWYTRCASVRNQWINEYFQDRRPTHSSSALVERYRVKEMKKKTWALLPIIAVLENVAYTASLHWLPNTSHQIWTHSSPGPWGSWPSTGLPGQCQPVAQQTAKATFGGRKKWKREDPEEQTTYWPLFQISLSREISPFPMGKS